MSDAKSDKEPPPWTIRGVEPEIRNALLEAAKREKQTMGEWLNRQGRAMVLSDRQRSRAPVPVAPPSDLASDPPPVVTLTELVAAAREITGIEGAPKGLGPLAFGLVRDRLKAIRAATPSPTKEARMSDKADDPV